MNPLQEKIVKEFREKFGKNNDQAHEPVNSYDFRYLSWEGKGWDIKDAHPDIEVWLTQTLTTLLNEE